MLRSLFIDLNSYFASVEQELRPELRGRPVIVVPVAADTTSAIAASYEAKALGISTGTMVAEAKRLCPTIAIVPARHSVYVDYHHRIVAAVETVVHVERVMSIDEMACSLTGRDCHRDRAVELAHAVKRALAEQVGSTLRCSIGIAPNDYLAKTASDMQKPDGLVVIEQTDLPHVLYPLKLRDLVGVGKRMGERLYRHGIYTVEQLCTASAPELHRAWGSVEGERMYRRLRGEHVPHLETQKSSISHQHVMEPGLRSREGASGVLHRLLQKAAMRLRSYGMHTSNLYVSVRFRNGEKWKSDLDITPTADTIQLTQILTSVLETCPWSQGEPFKVTVAFTKIVDGDATPLPLFDHTGPARERLNDTLDQLNTKYGKNTIYMGTSWNAKHSAPMRIAFHHIPDLETDSDDLSNDPSDDQ
jgi:DNA polymerase-4